MEERSGYVLGEGLEYFGSGFRCATYLEEMEKVKRGEDYNSGIVDDARQFLEEGWKLKRGKGFNLGTPEHGIALLIQDFSGEDLRKVIVNLTNVEKMDESALDEAIYMFDRMGERTLQLQEKIQIESQKRFLGQVD
tara:strand:+ start:555 stop:962 length:408 start_codon:yes stop_codon:yes gene_type:complete